MTKRKTVPIPGTERSNWPRSRFVESAGADTDVRLTAWLRPRPGCELDRARALKLGALPPLRRSYADRQGLERQTDADPADVEVLRAYCQSHGIETTQTHWRSITIAGPIERLVAAFGATVAIFEDDAGQRFRHRSGALQVPPEIVAIVQGIFGLHQWPRSRKLEALQRHATPLTAREVATRYQFPEGDGTGQTIGVLALNGAFSPDDFDRCMKAPQLSPAQPIVKPVDRLVLAHKRSTVHDLEVALDVQIIASLAPGSRIVVYNAPNDERGFLDAVRTALFDAELAPSVLSISYGWPERAWTPAALTIMDELFAAAALLGVSVFCSSGDNGAELDDQGHPHVLAPASSPFATACGATVIASDAGEEAWSQTGGGFSERFDVPTWQGAAQPVAMRYGVRDRRGVPDVAAQQSPGYYVVMSGTELAMGGTSAVAPLWSALTARINQRLGIASGFFSPLLYAHAAAGIFTSVTRGSNGPFQAGAGWNPCTGLGVPIGTRIETALRGS
jgi:kumamolisin